MRVYNPGAIPDGTVARRLVELITRRFVHGVAPNVAVTEGWRFSPTTISSVAAVARPTGGLTPITRSGGSVTI